MHRPHSSNGEIEQLGSITCPSGILVLLDGGLAWMWSHDRAPLLPERVEFAEAANKARDFAIHGSDAEAAGIAFNRQRHPLYLFDIPVSSIESTIGSFQALVRERKLDARLEPLVHRVAHRQRVDLSLKQHGGIGEVSYHGMWAITAGDLPPDRPLPLFGERMPSGPDEGRWRRLIVEIRRDEVASSRRVGHVLVDEARLMAVDADGLGSWNDFTSLDGKADLVFWGRDAAGVAAETGAGPIHLPGENDVHGWADLLMEEAKQKYLQLDSLRSAERKFALDFRPHTHLWQMMAQARATRTESGMIDLAGTRACLFMTSWGDGAFPVEADFDSSGRLLRIRIEVGCDEIVQRQRGMEELWFGAFAKSAFVSARVARDKQPVCFLYREAPDHEQDSGWRVFSGDESEGYVDDPANAVLLPLRDLLKDSPDLKEMLRTPAPCAFHREEAEASFQFLEDFTPRED